MQKPTTGINPVTTKTTTALFLTLQETVHRYLRLDKTNDYFIDLVLASAISIELEKPLWAMIEAPSSSGKTEILRLLKDIPHFHKMFTVTRKALFSGHKESNGGYIPHVIGKKGILCFPDFTTVMSMRSDDRSEVFNQLRVAYDGEAGSATGVDPDSIVTWVGKLSCLACVTGAIEKYKEQATDLGERFLYLHHHVPKFDTKYKVNPKKKILSEIAARHAQSLIELAQAQLSEIILTDEDNQMINRLALLIAQSRAVVEHSSGGKREILYVHSPEEPYRAIEQLEVVLRCLKAVHGNTAKRPYEVLKAIAISSIPEKRWKLMEVLYKKGPKSLSSLAIHASMVETTTRRVSEDLEMLGLFETLLTDGRKNANVSSLVDEVRKEMSELNLI
jgi:hypothetical protein